MVVNGGVITAIVGPVVEEQAGAKNGAIQRKDIPKISNMSVAAQILIVTTAGNVPAAVLYDQIHWLHLLTPLNIVRSWTIAIYIIIHNLNA